MWAKAGQATWFYWVGGSKTNQWKISTLQVFSGLKEQKALRLVAPVGAEDEWILNLHWVEHPL